jgi:hypothetical protein
MEDLLSLPIKGEPNQLGTSHLSAERIQKQSEHKVHYNFMKKHEELAHREPVNSHRGKKTSYCLHHPVLRRRAPLQELGLYLMQAPNSPMALNNYITNESYI